MLIQLDHHWDAVKLYGRAIALWEPLVKQEDGGEFASDVGWCAAKRGHTLFLLGEKSKGLDDLRSARGLFQTAVERTGQAEAQDRLVRVEEVLAKFLGE